MRYVDLFCGAGGASCGLVRAGWECVGAADADADALAVYARNFPTHPAHALDLSRPLPAALAKSWKRSLRDGALWASSPCTDFSTANATPRTDGSRSGLTLVLAEHVRRLRPAWLLFENVPRAESSAEFEALVDTLDRLRYDVCYGVVNALDFGLAQSRKRLFLLAARDGDACAAWDRFATPRRAHATMRECFSKANVAVPAPFVYFQAPNEANRRSVWSVDAPAPTVRAIIRPFRDSYRFTPKDPTHDRRKVFAATCEHLAALQGFPRWFVFLGGQTACATAIGNAVPPPMASAVARAVDHAA